MDNIYFSKKNTVTKSNQLIESKHKLTLQQQKIICAVASKVQITDTEFTEYSFHMKELAELLELNRKGYYAEIRKVIRSLQTEIFTIHKIVDNKIKDIDINWFNRAEYNLTDNIVSLKFAEDLKPFLIELNGNFTSYKLGNIVKLNSGYSIRLYEILRSKSFKNKIEMPVEELYSMVSNNYERYTDFKKNVLEKCQKELKDKTDISFQFEEIKTGKKVTSIKFYIKSNKSNDSNEIAATLIEPKLKPKPKSQPKLQPNSDAIKLIKEIIKEDILDIDAQKIFIVAKGDINIIKEKYSYAKTVTKINNLVGWLIDAIEKDYKPPIGKVKVSVFNDYPQRTYDVKELEKKLLGRD
jgi:plasmid replication initiation protein